MTVPRTPPRFVPTLTDVIEPGPEVAPDAAMAEADRLAAVAIGPAPSSGTALLGVEEDLVQRVLERVDRLIEDRLSDAVAAVVQVQLDAMIPSLRSEIEGVLRTLVAESIAAELSGHQGSAPFSPL